MTLLPPIYPHCPTKAVAVLTSDDGRVEKLAPMRFKKKQKKTELQECTKTNLGMHRRARSDEI